FWQRAEVEAALRDRAIGRLFQLVSQYAGASQTRIGIACGMSQSKVSDIMRGVQQVEKLAVFERIADALGMPGPARAALGLAPPQPSGTQRPAHIPATDTIPALATTRVSGLLSLSTGDEQEETDPVRRRTFVGLAGASIFSAMLTGTAGETAADAEPLAPALTGHPADPTPGSLDSPPDLAALTAAVDNARREYQACHYSELIRRLPGLLARLHTACTGLDGEARLRAYAL